MSEKRRDIRLASRVFATIVIVAQIALVFAMGGPEKLIAAPLLGAVWGLTTFGAVLVLFNLPIGRALFVVPGILQIVLLTLSVPLAFLMGMLTSFAEDPKGVEHSLVYIAVASLNIVCLLGAVITFSVAFDRKD